MPTLNTGARIELSLAAAIERRLRNKLSTLLPQLEADARQAYEDISYKEIGLKLPPIPGLHALPPPGSVAHGNCGFGRLNP